MMVALSIRLIILGAISHHPVSPPIFKISGFPALFGSAVYSFMCHHSIPGMITPVKKKERLFLLMGVDFFMILILYYMITLTGIFAISPSDMKALHSLNFFHPSIPDNASDVLLLLAGIYLALFPVVSLSSNFPIIIVTLRDNLKSLFKLIFKRRLRDGKEDFPFLIDRIFFPLLSLLPPTVLAFATQQDSLLVSITGSFPGVGVQYLIPVSLVIMARYKIRKYTVYRNPHRSPFSRLLFLVLVVAWSVLSVVLIIVDMVLKPPTLAVHPLE